MCNIICQLYLSEAGEKKEKKMFSYCDAYCESIPRKIAQSLPFFSS